MKNLEEAILYTEKKKNEQLVKLGKKFSEKSFNDLEQYLSGEKDVTSVGQRLENIGIWCHWAFLYDYLKNNHIDYKKLAESNNYFSTFLNWEFLIGKIFPLYDNITNLNTITSLLGQLMFLGWWDDVKKVGDLTLFMLTSKYLNGGSSDKKHSWFILELYCCVQNKSLDKKKLNYPQTLDVYRTALQFWDTKDTAIVDNVVTILSEYHIISSDEYSIKDEFGNETDAEFSSSNFFIFPVEILAFIAVRRFKGLPLPAQFSHPLMQLPINQLPNQQIQKPPMNKIVLDCMNKIKRDYQGNDLNFG